jgi:hypothetical protein
MASNTPRIDRLQKNYIINGDMRISQRGTSFTSIADSTYNLDRYVYFKTGAMVHNLTQDTDVPTLAESDYLFQNSLRLNLTTPDTSIASTDRVEISQIVEGYNWANLAQKDFTLSFWVKATLTGTYCVYFRNSGADRSYIAEYTINASNTWERKTIHISASPSAGTWNYLNGIGIRIGWTLAAGSNFHTTPNAWQTGNFLATANQVNGVNTGATDFRLVGVMLCEGHLDDPEFNTFGKDFLAEVQACQRYFEKSYELTQALGANPTDPANTTRFSLPSSQAVRTPNPFKVSKRASPSITVYSAANGSSGQVDINNVGQAVGAISPQQNGFWAETTSAATGSITFGYQWTAQSEL